MKNKNGAFKWQRDMRENSRVGTGMPNDSRFSRISFFLLSNFWLCWVFVAACKISLVATSRDYSPAVRGLLIALASLVLEHGLESLDFGSCGTQA